MKQHLNAVDIAIVSIFCAIFAALSLTLGPLSFNLFRLPILHDFAASFSLLLVTWLVGKFGAASIVGVIGSIIAILVRPIPPIQVGFIVSAIVFDLLMSINRNRLYANAYNVIVSALVTAASAYLAGVVIGIFLMGMPLDMTTLQWALTFWGGWHLIGGIVTVAITLPVIGVLEKANARRIKNP